MNQQAKLPMDKYFNLPLNKHFIAMLLSLTVPSLWLFQKRLGLSWAIIYILVTGFLLAIALHWLLPRLFNLKQSQLTALVMLTALGLIMAFFLLYPLESSGRFGLGSDRDEALNIAVTELVAWRYPYYPTTHLNGPITPLPGAILLALPWVIIGNSAYQNFFWLALFFIVLKRFLLPVKGATLLLVWIILAASPAVAYEWISGGDLLANNLYIFIFSLLAMKIVPVPTHPIWIKGCIAILLGLSLSSRPNFLFLLPVFFSTLRLRSGFKPALFFTIFVLFISGLITIPFFLYDPQGFSPLHLLNKFSVFEPTISYAGQIITGLTLTTALWLASRQLDEGLATMYYYCAIVQSVPIFGGIFLGSLQAGYPDFSFMADRFGLNFLFFGTVAAWYHLNQTTLTTSRY